MSYQIFVVLHKSVSKKSTLGMNNSPKETPEKRQLYCWGRSLDRGEKGSWPLPLLLETQMKETSL